MRKIANFNPIVRQVGDNIYNYWSANIGQRFESELEEIEFPAINDEKIGGNMLKFLAKDWVSNYNSGVSNKK
jgi:hypothetical protein